MALVCGDERLSYAQLNARANRVAHYLRAAGVGPEDLGPDGKEAREGISRSGLRRVEEALGDGAVGIDAAITQERPMLTNRLLVRPIDRHDEDLFFRA